MKTVIIRTNVLASRETDEAIYINHPKDFLKFLYLPKSEIVSRKPVGSSLTKHDIEIPEWLADQHNF